METRMLRRTKKDHFARVRKLYAFDGSLGSGIQNQDFLCVLSDLCGKVRLAGFDEAGRGALAGPVTVGCVHFDQESLGSGLAHLAGVDDSKRLSPTRREEMYRQITEVASWGVGWANAQEIDRLGIVSAVSLAARRAYITMGQRVDLFLCDRGLSLLSDLAIERLNHLAPQSSDLSISQPSVTAAKPVSTGKHLFTAEHAERAEHFVFKRQTTAKKANHSEPFCKENPYLCDLSVLCGKYPLELSFTKGDSRSLHIAAASILAKVARDRMMLNLHQRFPPYGFAANKGYGTPAHLAALCNSGPSAIHRRSFKRVRSKEYGVRSKGN